MNRALSRRTALRGSLVASMGLMAGVAPTQAAPSPDAALIAPAEDFQALCAREDQAWAAINEEDFDETPALMECRALSQACRDAGEALAVMPALTPAGLAAKAAAMLPLVGPRLDTQTALMEHQELAVSILRDAAQLGGGAHV